MTATLPRDMRILISGAGIAGPALACQLSHYGAQVTVVEIAPALRHSGFAVDFRGPTHMAALDRLGVLEELQGVQTHGSAMVCVDEHGNTLFELPAEFTGGELEVLRRDLSEILYKRSLATTEYLFGDTITAVTESSDGAEVQFKHSRSRTYDLIIGADGIHSRVRQLVFGAERQYVRHLGYHIAGWEVPNTFGTKPIAQHYGVPGKMASVATGTRDPSKATVLVVFRSPELSIDWQDTDQQKQLIAHTYAGLPWHVPQLLDGLTDAHELYFDAIARVHMRQWTRGRVALLGDAAWLSPPTNNVCASMLDAGSEGRTPANSSHPRRPMAYGCATNSSGPGRSSASCSAAPNPLPLNRIRAEARVRFGPLDSVWGS
jgi:2-polyprenyl-6-methoxyphenol hydroxylase-like FAD-dependent oxidoreductase